MCAQFMIEVVTDCFANQYKVGIPAEISHLKGRFLPHGLAPVIVREGEKRVLKPMRFSLLPSWSKEKRVQFATHNARIETVLEKPTWKTPFLSKRCLVPMTGFIESIYKNEYAGNRVCFSSQDSRLLTAAGIWDLWLDPVNEEVIESFAILTQAPLPFVSNIGHDRSPIFLQESAFDDWLTQGQQPSTKLMDILKTKQEEFNFKVEVDRPLKAGWEKRIH